MGQKIVTGSCAFNKSGIPVLGSALGNYFYVAKSKQLKSKVLMADTWQYWGGEWVGLLEEGIFHTAKRLDVNKDYSA